MIGSRVWKEKGIRLGEESEKASWGPDLRACGSNLLVLGVSFVSWRLESDCSFGRLQGTPHRRQRRLAKDRIFRLGRQAGQEEGDASLSVGEGILGPISVAKTMGRNAMIWARRSWS